MRRIALILAVVSAVTTAAIAGAVPAFAAHGRPSAAARFYYLSLGDSLAQGVQPNAQGHDVETTAGYPDQLFTALRVSNPALHLVKLGCPGETTATMIKGGICTYPLVSQLAQAASFLAHHQGHVQLVTIDIGANDLNPCLALSSLPKLIACLEKVIPVTEKNLATIMATLGKAGPAPVRIIGMNYYDPELANWLKGTAAGKTLAQDSVALSQAFGSDLASVYTKFKAPTADVYTAFKTADFKTMVTLPGGQVPKDVAYLCAYTWNCVAPPRGPDIHANRLGYAIIASAFLQKILG